MMNQRLMTMGRSCGGALLLTMAAAAAAGAQGPVAVLAKTPASSAATSFTAFATAAAPTVDLVICLDTSGSMSGLIDAARAGIWTIVNDLALAEPTPTMRVALLTYGNSGHASADGWVKIDTGFTSDLDLVSERLFALSTSGGTELVGRVVQTAVGRLAWSDNPQALKLLVVAGNESADQDTEVSYAASCKAAITAGVQINAIYCGPETDELAPGWRDVAKRAEGCFHSIDHNQQQVAIATPFDAQLAELNVKLNATYLPFGQDGYRGWTNQIAQDKNAASCNAQVAAQRSLAKSTLNYCNSSWDLVDACRAQSVKLIEIKDAELPEVLRGKTDEEKTAYVERMSATRAALQKQVQAISKQRDVFVAAERKRRALKSGRSFDDAVREAVRAQAKAKGLHFAAPAPAADPVMFNPMEPAKSTKIGGC